MEWLIPLITQVLSGVAGGNITGAKQNLSLGRTGNSIAGGIGGLLLGQLSAYLDSTQGSMAASQLLTQVFGGGVGGVALTAIIALIRNMMNKNNINTKL